MGKLKLAINISGRGSNLHSIIKACQEPNFPAEIKIVLSNSKSASGLKYAKNASINSIIVDHRNFKDRDDFDQRMTEIFEAHAIDLICLAGFNRLLSKKFCIRWRNRLVNIHPSILPAFKGLNAHRLALKSGVRFSGCTVHYVRHEMDAGPIISQAVVPVFTKDTVKTLSKRILLQEHQIYPHAIRLIAEKRIRVYNDIVKIKNHFCDSSPVCNPSK